MEEHPFLSVLIPMRNEAAHIGKCLESVLAQDYPPDRMEVLVLDGDSDDESCAVIEAYAARDRRVRLLRNPGRIVPTALNIGIRAARGEIIVRVDGHTLLEPRYVREGVAALQRSAADNVGGPMIARGGGPVGDAVALAMNSPFGVGAYFHYGTEECFVDTVYMGMWPRQVFARAGLFDEELVRNQDDELNYRLRKLGGRILMTPRMHSSYQNRQDLLSLARQFYQYGLWKIRVCQKHPRQMSWRHFVPPALVLLLLAAASLGWMVPWVGRLGAAAALAYGAGVAVASAWVARRAARSGRGPKAAWLPVVFAVMHLAWGMGFLVGLVRYLRRWFRSEPMPPRLAAGSDGAPELDHAS